MRDAASRMTWRAGVSTRSIVAERVNQRVIMRRHCRLIFHIIMLLLAARLGSSMFRRHGIAAGVWQQEAALEKWYVSYVSMGKCGQSHRPVFGTTIKCKLMLRSCLASALNKISII